VTDIIADIAAASAEQSTGIDQVNRAVTQMDETVQANTTQTADLSATARNLSAQAQQLQALVARFKLADRPSAPALAPPPAPHARPASPPRQVPVPAPPAIVRRSPVSVPLTNGRATNGVNGAHHHDDGFEEF